MEKKQPHGFVRKSVLVILLLVFAAGYALVSWRFQDDETMIESVTKDEMTQTQAELVEEIEEPEQVAEQPIADEQEVIVDEPPQQTELVPEQPENATVDSAELLLQNGAIDEQNYYLPPEADIGTPPSEDVAAMMEISPPDPDAVPPGEPPDPNIPPPGEPANPFLPPPGEPASTIPPPGAEDGDFIIGTLKFAEPGKIIKSEDRENQTTTNTQ